jgi:hypothetical protein
LILEVDEWEGALKLSTMWEMDKVRFFLLALSFRLEP